MVRRAFFSFHYANDIWRVNQVRNSWITYSDRKTAGYIDSAEFEKIKKQGRKAVENWIDFQLINTSVTVVLIGSETSSREYVRYEIQESYKRGNGIVGIYIHNLKNNDGITSLKGDLDFGKIGTDKFGRSLFFRDVARTYDYVMEGGYKNIGSWIEEAARNVGR